MNLSDLIDHEPPHVHDPDAAIRGGQRRKRQRQGAMLGTFALTAGVVGGAVLLVHAPTAAKPTTVALQPLASATPADTGDGSVEYRIARANLPADWTITHIEKDAGGWWADIDDGNGGQRFGLMQDSRYLQTDPCSDPEYVDGATCTTTVLDATTKLIVRGASHDQGGFSSAYAEIVHSDGSGVEVSLDNATWKDIPKGTVITTEAEKRALTLGTINDPTLLLSTDQLVTIVKAYAAAG